MRTSRPNLRISTYDDVASDYYDPIRHPTCANFAELSNAFLVPRIHRYAAVDMNILEVGAGRSTVAPALHKQGLPLTQLNLLDQSDRMLAHSQEWERSGARLLIGNACRTELPAEHFKLIVSALGDPYNCPTFWREVARLLELGGVCLFTSPATEWAVRFRAADAEAQAHAEFVVADGSTLLVPSKIQPLDRQVRMVEDAGLHVVDVDGLSAEELLDVPSPKLLLDERTRRLPIVRGFTVQRA
jgi:SAM-dependent methyltransferase